MSAVALHVDVDKSIEQIQKEFSLLFPYLKIEFFTIPHRMKEATANKYMVARSKKLNEITKKAKPVSIDLSNGITVSELESIFQKEVGLPVQVFRKSGTSWLETTSTDEWTLRKQNQIGEMLSTSANGRHVEEFDNDATK